MKTIKTLLLIVAIGVVSSYSTFAQGTAADYERARGLRANTRRPQPPVRSPDGKWEASIVNFNLSIRPVDGKDPITLSTDGSEGNYYNARSIAWSPDSSKIVVLHVRPGYKREVRFIESSPEDQIQPKFTSITYAKPGDVLDLEQPVLFDVATKKQFNIDNAFPKSVRSNRSDLAQRRSRLHV